MDDYYRIISRKHQEKIRALARQKGVHIHIAMRNIVNHLQTEEGIIRRFLTARQIESFLDTLNNA